MSAALTIQFASTLKPTVSAATGKVVPPGGDGFATLLAGAAVGEPVADGAKPSLAVHQGAVSSGMMLVSTDEPAATTVPATSSDAAASPPDDAVALETLPKLATGATPLPLMPAPADSGRHDVAANGNPMPAARQAADAALPVADGPVPAASPVAVKTDAARPAPTPIVVDPASPSPRAAATPAAKQSMLRARLLATATPMPAKLPGKIADHSPPRVSPDSDATTEDDAPSTADAAPIATTPTLIGADPATIIALPNVTVAPVQPLPPTPVRSDGGLTVATRSAPAAPPVVDAAPVPALASAPAADSVSMPAVDRPAAPVQIVGGAALQALGNPVATAAPMAVASATLTATPTPIPVASATLMSAPTPMPVAVDATPPTTTAPIAALVARATSLLPGVADGGIGVPAQVTASVSASAPAVPLVVTDVAAPIPTAIVPPPATMVAPPAPATIAPVAVAAAPIASLLVSTMAPGIPTRAVAGGLALSIPSPAQPVDAAPNAPIASESVVIASPLSVVAASDPSPMPVALAPSTGDQIAQRLSPTASRVAPLAGQPAPAAAPTTAAPRLMPAATPIGTTAPAAQAFAASIAAADRQDRLAATRGLTDSVAAATAASPTAPVAAPAGASADQPSLDMRQQSWPGAMIDHIEKLRDAADATSTRIRVVPDALGSIDVSVRRHDDGAVQVSLVADRPQTQAMIAEARPELTRLADERGTRLEVNVGGSTAGFGGSADSRQPATQPQVAQRRAPASAFPSDDTTDSADGRVA